jgi:hypothetical protein
MSQTKHGIENLKIPQNSLAGVAKTNLTHTPISEKPNITSDTTNQ